MLETNLDRLIADALAKLQQNTDGSTPASDTYISSFRASAQAKAEAVLQLLHSGAFRAQRPVFLSIGGGDGEELAYLVERSQSRFGVLVEHSRNFADMARARSLQGGGTIEVFEGTAQTRTSEAIERAAQLVRQGGGDALIVTCHAVLHELYDRGEAFDELAFFGAIFKHQDIPLGFTYREPGDVTTWPPEIMISADCTSQSLLRLAEAIRTRHVPLRELLPTPQILGDASVRMHRTLALELLAKLFYIDDLRHEIDERSTSVDHQHLTNAVYVAAGEKARLDHRLKVYIENRPTGSFLERWESFKVRADGLAGTVQHPLAIPPFHARLVVWRDVPANHQAPVNAPQDQAHPERLWVVPYDRNPYFTGRTEILDRIQRALANSDTATVTQAQAISGLGGVGKTQAALEYVYRHRGDYSAVFWIRAMSRASALSDLGTIAAAIAQADSPPPGEAQAASTVAKWLESNSGWLVVFDNADDLATIRDITPRPARGRILITTRLRSTGAYATEVRLDCMPTDEGALLILRRAKATQANGALSDVDPNTLDESRGLAAELGGLPLALDQAGAFINEMPSSVAEYRQLYHVEGERLRGMRGGEAFDHPPVSTTFSLAFARVVAQSPAASDVMRVAAFMAADAIPEEILRDIAAGRTSLGQVEFIKMLGEITRFSLASRDAQQKTLDVHRLVQQVLRDGMTPTERLSMVESAAESVVVRFPEHAFVDWGTIHRLIPHALALADFIKELSVSTPAAGLLLHHVGIYHAEHRKFAEGAQFNRSALEIIVHQRPNTREHASILNYLGWCLTELDKHDEAEPLHMQAIAIQKQHLPKGDRDVAVSMNNLARLHHKRKRLAKAEKGFRESIKILRSGGIGTKPLLSRAYGNLAAVMRAKENWKDAIKYFRLSEGTILETYKYDHPDLVALYVVMAATYFSDGDPKSSERLIKRAVAITEGAGATERWRLPDVLYVYAKFCRATKRWAEAAELERKAKSVEAEIERDSV